MHQEVQVFGARAGVLLGRVALAAAVLAPGSALATEAIESKGVAAIIGGDLGQARDKALDDAKRKAVEQVCGARVSAESITENFQLVTSRIYARSSGFVKKYDILSEFKEEGVYHVKIKAEVDADKIAENLDQIFSVKPRVIVMIAEQNVGAGNYAYWWGVRGFSSEMDIMQTSLIKTWAPKGFRFVDPSLLAGKLRVKRGMKKAELDNGTVVSLGRDAEAEVAIVGKVAVTDAGPVMEGVKMRSFHAVGTLRVLNIATGEIMAVADNSAVAAHIDGNQGGRLAIKALADKAGKELQKAIMAKWTAEAAGARDVELVLKGKLKSKQIREVKSFLASSVRGIERVDVRRRKKGTAFLSVRLRGTGLDLGESLENKSFEGFGLEIESATKKRVVLEVAQ